MINLVSIWNWLKGHLVGKKLLGADDLNNIIIPHLFTRMECRFQLLHPDSKRIIHKRIKQHFDRSTQKDWGFRDFVALKTILDDNYLKEDDSLELLYHIRPCSGGGEFE